MANPMLTRAQVRRVDRLATEELAIPGLLLMENAGRNAAVEIAAFSDQVRSGRTIIFCGAGNNGGDGFVIARHLLNQDRSVLAFLVGEPAKMSPDCATNHRILVAMGIEIPVLTHERQVVSAVDSIGPGGLVVDALLGTGAVGAVRSPMDVLIRAVNDARKAGVVSVDIPSGLDCDTGEVANVAIRADLTLTFVALKIGFRADSAVAYTARVQVLDIGAPPELITRVLADDGGLG